MRKPVKYRIAFLIVAAACFYVGTLFLPETLPDIILSFESIWANAQWRNTLLVTLAYFVFLPALYYFWIIQIGNQGLWKLLLVFSLSSLVARYNYPEKLAYYFEFITYLKYPIIAVLMVIEILLLVTIVKALWGARKLSGDPRIHMLEQYEGDNIYEKGSKEAKKLELALMFAHEPASWYYAIPRFSKNHVPAIANLHLWSAQWWHVSLVCVALVVATYASYLAIALWSETVAIVVATLVFYLIVMFIANYRVSKHYSVYLIKDKLMVNNSWWGMTIIPLSNIKQVETGSWTAASTKEQFHFGRGNANVKLTFVSEQKYYSGLATFIEPMDTLYLSVDDTSALHRICQPQQHTE